MSTVIKRVESEIKEIPGRWVICENENCKSYGSAFILDGNNHEVHIQKAGKRCRDVHINGCDDRLQLTSFVEIQRTPSATIVRCDCQNIVVCAGFTSTCDRCGADYNWNGTRLHSPDQWGEETGESYLDIIGPDYDDYVGGF